MSRAIDEADNYELSLMQETLTLSSRHTHHTLHETTVLIYL